MVLKVRVTTPRKEVNDVEMLTKEIRAKLPSLGATEKTSSAEKVCVVKYFQPRGELDLVRKRV